MKPKIVNVKSIHQMTSRKSPRKLRKNNSKKPDHRQLTLRESFFGSSRRPKPQATASAKMKLSLKETNITAIKKSPKRQKIAPVKEKDMTPEQIQLDDSEPEQEETNNNYVLYKEDKNLKKSAIPEPNNNYEDTDNEEEYSSGIPSAEQKPGEESVRFKCKICPEWFPNRYFMRKHMLIAHEDQVYECRVCAFTSVEPEKLRNHILKLHVTKKEKSGNFSIEDMQEELEQLIERKVPRKVMMEDGVSLGRNVNSKMKYACALCSRIYSSKYALERHVRCHTLEKPYECDVCDFSTSYHEHMMRHMTSVHLIVHSNEPHVKYSKKKRKLEKNEVEVVSEGDVANNSLNDDGTIVKKKRNILRQRYECAVCGVKSSHKSDLVVHIKEKHPSAHVESMKNRDGSKVHLIVSSAKKPPPSRKLTIHCQHCLLIFHDTWKYKVHLRSHTGVKPFSCSECAFRATSKMTVRDHVHRKHSDVAQPKIFLRTVGIDGEVEEVALAVPWREFKCELCGEDLKDNYSLKMHKNKEHKSEFPFECIECKHKDLTKANLIIHCLKEHEKLDLDTLVCKNGKLIKISPVRLPLCEICNKIFSYKSQLSNHLRLHTGERLFQCAHCTYKTNVKASLDNHIMKNHLGVKPYRKAKKISLPKLSNDKKVRKVTGVPKKA